VLAERNSPLGIVDQLLRAEPVVEVCADLIQPLSDALFVIDGPKTKSRGSLSVKITLISIFLI